MTLSLAEKDNLYREALHIHGRAIWTQLHSDKHGSGRGRGTTPTSSWGGGGGGERALGAPLLLPPMIVEVVWFHEAAMVINNFTKNAFPAACCTFSSEFNAWLLEGIVSSKPKSL